MATQKIIYPNEKVINSAFLKAGRNDVVKWEVFPIPDRCRLKLVFEDWEKSKRHGVWIHVNGDLIINNVQSQNMEIWADTAPEIVFIDVAKTQGELHLYNIWDS